MPPRTGRLTGPLSTFPGATRNCVTSGPADSSERASWRLGRARSSTRRWDGDSDLIPPFVTANSHGFTPFRRLPPRVIIPGALPRLLFPAFGRGVRFREQVAGPSFPGGARGNGRGAPAEGVAAARAAGAGWGDLQQGSRADLPGEARTTGSAPRTSPPSGSISRRRPSRSES